MAHYYRVYSEMMEANQEDRVLRPKTFSATKIANYSAAVYHRFREMVPALLKTRLSSNTVVSGEAERVSKRCKRRPLW